MTAKSKSKEAECHVHLYQDGIEVDFFFDPTHPILSEYPLSPKQLLLQGLAEKLRSVILACPISSGVYWAR